VRLTVVAVKVSGGHLVPVIGEPAAAAAGRRDFEDRDAASVPSVA